MIFPARLSCLLSLSLWGACAQAQDELLPLPQGGPELSLFEAPAGEVRFLKPTKSIKPPALPAASPVTTAALQPQVSTPTVARLRRLILMPGGLTPEAMREQMLAGGQTRTPVTVVGMEAPAPVLRHLAGFFGDDVTADTQKQLLETVRQGIGGSRPPRRVEVVGWLPSEGVMAVAVYPES